MALPPEGRPAATVGADRVPLEERSLSGPQKWVHGASLRARPTQLGALLKLVARVRRQYVRTSRGLWFWIDPASQLGAAVLRQGDYEPSMSGALDALLRPGDVFVDVGANEGFFSVLGSRLVGRGQVVAVEPQTRLTGVILRNLEINGCHNVTLRAVALDAAPGWADLYLRPTTNTGASGLFRRRVDLVAESVPTLPLDVVLDDEEIGAVRVLKVDCEGAEDRVVAGASRILGANRAEFVLMEYHPSVGPGARERCLALHERLLAHGYVLSRSLDRHIYHRPGAEAELAGLEGVRTGVAPAF